MHWYSSVGQSPPEPPTLRGRIGALIIRVMQRALFWYTPQIVRFHRAAIRAQEQQAKGLEAATQATHDIQTQWKQQALGTQVKQLEEAVAAAAKCNRELREELNNLAAGHAMEIEHIRSEIGDRPAVTELEQRIQNLDHGLAHMAILERDVSNLRARVYSDLMARERDKESAARRRMESSGHFDDIYVRLEDEFRGSSQMIKERLTIYIPIVERALGGKENAAILDIGCGRGDWLELLRDHGWPSVGIDQNRLMVRLCETRGLRGREGDGISYLKSLPKGCLDLITAFHVIEHLPPKALVELLTETFRVLAPTGLAIFETPNPRNILVSTQYFYMDPTHRRPIPPELAHFLLRTHGFEQVDMIELARGANTPQIKPNDNGDLAGRFTDLFSSPQDYGVVAWKTRGGSDRDRAAG